MITFTLNGHPVETDDAPDTPLLWVLRDTFGLTGSKFGCGMAQCGACTVHINEQAMRSCVLPVSSIAGQQVTTIEGLGTPENMHPLQKSWSELSVPQCGYCQSGQIMSAAALLKHTPEPTEAEVDSAMAGNICRCGTYLDIKQAIFKTAKDLHSANAEQIAATANSNSDLFYNASGDQHEQ